MKSILPIHIYKKLIVYQKYNTSKIPHLGIDKQQFFFL
jgi:hypothetical protein